MRTELYYFLYHHTLFFMILTFCLTWSSGSIFATLECALAEALSHPRQDLSAVSDLYNRQKTMTKVGK